VRVRGSFQGQVAAIQIPQRVHGEGGARPKAARFETGSGRAASVTRGTRDSTGATGVSPAREHLCPIRRVLVVAAAARRLRFRRR
jgi:hypothetical protein